jgi:hypothetical protein
MFVGFFGRLFALFAASLFVLCNACMAPVASFGRFLAQQALCKVLNILSASIAGAHPNLKLSNFFWFLAFSEIIQIKIFPFSSILLNKIMD